MTALQQPNIFEYPLTESIRNFLRIEACLKQLEYLVHESQSSAEHLSALILLLKLLDLLSRTDIKTELIRELEFQQNNFSVLSENPAVDKDKLSTFLKQLKKLHSWAIQTHGRLGDNLRQDPFIELLSKKESFIFCTTNFDMPELERFINLDMSLRQDYLERWLDKLYGLKTSVEVILRLTRELSRFTQVTASMGDYLIEKPEAGISLLRISLTQCSRLFPEVSAGKHRIAIHFFSLSDELTKIKCNDPIEFNYATCGWKNSLLNENNTT